MKAIIDADACTGCDLCTQTCAEVFKLEGDKAIVIADPVPDGATESCKQSAEECPVEAIKIEE